MQPHHLIKTVFQIAIYKVCYHHGLGVSSATFSWKSAFIFSLQIDFCHYSFLDPNYKLNNMKGMALRVRKGSSLCTGGSCQEISYLRPQPRFWRPRPTFLLWFPSLVLTKQALHTKNCGNSFTINKQNILGCGESKLIWSFPREEHTDWLSSAKWPSLKTYVQIAWGYV